MEYDIPSNLLTVSILDVKTLILAKKQMNFLTF